MKIFNVIFLAALTLSFSACLKPKNEFGGMRTDPGTIVTTILEQQYIIGDNSNNHWGYEAFASVDFSNPTAEDVRFFALRISQPRDTKISGPLTLRITSATTPGFTPLPAGAITIPSEITVQPNGANQFDVPVYFRVNKTGLVATASYGLTFTITSASQGVVDELGKSINVQLKNSKYTARYQSVTSVTDSANLYRIVNNTKPTLLDDLGNNDVGVNDVLFNRYPFPAIARAIQAINLSTGARIDLFQPVYRFNAAGDLIAVLNRAGANLNAVIQPGSKFTYVSNDNRSFTADYTIRLTVGGLTQPYRISERWTYSTPQAY